MNVLLRSWWKTLPLAGLVAALLFLGTATGSPQTATAAPVDACGVSGFDVPDSGTYFDFTDACANHDSCYGNGGTESDRRACDRAFLDDMLSSCQSMWPTLRDLKGRTICSGVATTYYLGVALFGWITFPYGNVDPI